LLYALLPPLWALLKLPMSLRGLQMPGASAGCCRWCRQVTPAALLQQQASERWCCSGFVAP
jgi:hypothetical protein